MSKRLALCFSRGGTTMRQVLLSCLDDTLRGVLDPVVAIASRDNIRGIELAKATGMQESQIVVCDPRAFATKEEFGQALLNILWNNGVEIVSQLGWLPQTPKVVIDAYPNMIHNQHPGPLDTGRPDFGGPGMYGLRVHCARLYFARKSGLEKDQFTEATAHYVVEEIDKGYVIAREKIPILKNDDVISLQERVLLVEHKLQIKALKMLADGTAQPLLRSTPLVSDDQINLLNEAKHIACLLFPKG